MKETRTITCAPEEESYLVDLLRRFGWNLISSDRYKIGTGVSAYAGGTSLGGGYSTYSFGGGRASIKTEYQIRLTLERDSEELKHFKELLKLEREFEELQAPRVISDSTQKVYVKDPNARPPKKKDKTLGLLLIILGSILCVVLMGVGGGLSSSNNTLTTVFSLIAVASLGLGLGLGIPLMVKYSKANRLYNVGTVQKRVVPGNHAEIQEFERNKRRILDAARDLYYSID